MAKTSSNKTWPEWLRTLQPSDLLFPENEYKIRVIPEGLMKYLMKQAQELLLSRPNASPLEKFHWGEICKGIPPYNYVIERKTKKGPVHVKHLCETTEPS